MIENFVTYEQALKLKRLGFNEPCLRLWEKTFMYTALVEHLEFKKVVSERYINAPLTTDVFRWFRDKHNIYAGVNTDITMEPKFCYYVYKYDLEKFSEGWWIAVVNSDLYYTFEEAESACIDNVIEILQIINKTK